MADGPLVIGRGDDRDVDDLQLGAALRRLRVRAGRRQVDVARAAGVSQSLVSAIECSHLDALSLATVRRVFAAVDARFEARVLWRGAALDRLLDEGHARLVEASVAMLRRDAWDVRVEVSYAVYGERGSIDVLGGRADRRAIVVQEIKTELVRLEETIRKLDEKERLVRGQLASTGSDGIRASSAASSSCPTPTGLAGRSGRTAPCSTSPSRRGLPRCGAGCATRTGRCPGSYLSPTPSLAVQTPPESASNAFAFARVGAAAWNRSRTAPGSILATMGTSAGG